jgi:hypothetical protein
MFGRPRKAVDEADLEGLKGFYDALGLGFPLQALRIFGGDTDGGGDGGGAEDAGGSGGQGAWCLRHLGRTLRCVNANDLSNRELFVLPEAWEVIRVVAHRLAGRQTKRGDQITVGGDLYCRPHGTWENMRIPFLHTWTMCAGKALLFENLLDATDLRREGVAVACRV